MNYTIGIDVGTYETKGVLVDNKGLVVSEARRKHKMLIPKPGWAEAWVVSAWASEKEGDHNSRHCDDVHELCHEEKSESY